MNRLSGTNESGGGGGEEGLSITAGLGAQEAKRSCDWEECVESCGGPLKRKRGCKERQKIFKEEGKVMKRIQLGNFG